MFAKSEFENIPSELKSEAISLTDDYYDMISDFQKMPSGPSLSNYPQFKEESIKKIFKSEWNIKEDYFIELHKSLQLER